jgi:acetoin utilization protein AcuB
MLIRDIMSTNVVTIPSTTSIADAKRIMEAHRFRRLPVVDKGKLTGIVTTHGLDSVSPSKATSLTVWELTYLLNSTTVKEIMEKDVLTVSPDTTAEEALALAQSHRVGALIVVEDGHVVGITTTNDFFYKIINPLLGLGEKGSRIEIANFGNSKTLEDIITTVNKQGVEILALHIETLPGKSDRDLALHLNTENPDKLIAALKTKGYRVAVRKR